MPKLRNKPVTVPDVRFPPTPGIAKAMARVLPDLRPMTPREPAAVVAKPMEPARSMVKLTPGEQMEQDMLHKGPHRLEGTWRTWVRGNGIYFEFITEHKKHGWSPNYAAMYAGGQGKPAQQEEASA